MDDHIFQLKFCFSNHHQVLSGTVVQPPSIFSLHPYPSPHCNRKATNQAPALPFSIGLSKGLPQRASANWKRGAGDLLMQACLCPLTLLRLDPREATPFSWWTVSGSTNLMTEPSSEWEVLAMWPLDVHGQALCLSGLHSILPWVLPGLYLPPGCVGSLPFKFMSGFRTIIRGEF